MGGAGRTSGVVPVHLADIKVCRRNFRRLGCDGHYCSMRAASARFTMVSFPRGRPKPGLAAGWGKERRQRTGFGVEVELVVDVELLALPAEELAPNLVLVDLGGGCGRDACCEGHARAGIHAARDTSLKDEEIMSRFPPKDALFPDAACAMRARGGAQGGNGGRLVVLLSPSRHGPPARLRLRR